MSKFKILGMGISALGFLLSYIGGCFEDAEQERLIEERVNEAIQNREKES